MDRVEVGNQGVEPEHALVVGQGALDDSLVAIHQQDGGPHLGNPAAVTDESSDTAGELDGRGGEGERG